jgi:hypothetical protein
MNYLRNIEIESHASNGYVNLLTEGATSAIEFEMVRDEIVVNMHQFRQFCERDDVSLSLEERDSLLASIETEIAETRTEADVTAQEFVDGQESVIVFYVSAAHATGTAVALLADTELPFELSDIAGTVADGRWTWNGLGNVTDERANNVQTIDVYSDRAEWLRQIVDYVTSDGDREGVAEYLKRSGLTDAEIEECVGEWLREDAETCDGAEPVNETKNPGFVVACCNPAKGSIEKDWFSYADWTEEAAIEQYCTEYQLERSEVTIKKED